MRGRFTLWYRIRVNLEHVPVAERVTLDHLAYDHDGYSHINLRFGYLDEPRVTEALALTGLRLPAAAGASSGSARSACTRAVSRASPGLALPSLPCTPIRRP